MLESYFVRPNTVDGVRASWIGAEIERYVVWLAESGYSARSVLRRVPLLVCFGEFARARGARTVAELPEHIEPFVAERMVGRPAVRCDGRLVAREFRNPVEQMLALAVPGFVGRGRRRAREPFTGELPGFFEYLVSERGLRPRSLRNYQDHLVPFERYLARIGVVRLLELSPEILSAFIAERAGRGLAKTTLRDCCGVLRVLLRYAHREGVLHSDLSAVMEWPQAYRLSSIPRLIRSGGCWLVLIAVRQAGSVTGRSCFCWLPTGFVAAR
jgi:integrase/recombinase XerD